MRTSFLALMALVSPAMADPAFQPVEIAQHVYGGGWEHFVGGGLAVFDCNGDDRPEMLAAGGENPSTLFLNNSTPGNIRFEPMPDGLAITGMTGAYPLDIDGDGTLDLAILRAGENRLLKGQGECQFTPFDLDLAGGDRWTTAFSATWEAGQDWPTLAFGNYVDRSDPDGPFEACDDSFLYRPAGKGYGAPIPLTPGFCPLSALFSDWSRSGHADLRLSNDRHYYVRGGQEQMWAMETTPRLLTEADGWQRHMLWGMGIAQRDLTGDGLPEVYLTSMGDQRLQVQTGEGAAFVDVPFDLGTTAHRPYTGGDGRPSTGWHVAFGDVDLNGRDDIFVSKGNVEQMPVAAMLDPNNLLMQGADGKFVEKGDVAGVASLHRGRGAAMVDFDGDGLLDLAVVNRRAPLEVWQNVTATDGNWLAVELSQPGGNRLAVGAWLELKLGDRILTREITVGGGQAGGTSVPEHFGLGAAERADLRVIWPDGAVSDWVVLPINQTSRIARNGDTLAVDG
ncbi:CRTAC1 family protein [Shimia biformata]|uniref:CRTAC1 family protein n=1 Tax=Shimia biformata TaxID=1294299 RepID=UPI00195265B2|nr:CRTAC1 family protein [Shimia biformata]